MTNTTKSPGEEKALMIVNAVLDKQAIEPVVLDVHDVSTLCDYFVICAGETGRQVTAIADGLRRLDGLDVGHVEADENGDWVMIDCHDVIVHAFTKGTRMRYGLEDLWKQARQIYPVERAGKSVTKKPVKKAGVKRVIKTKKPAKKIAKANKKKKVIAKVVSGKKKANKR